MDYTIHWVAADGELWPVPDAEVLGNATADDATGALKEYHAEYYGRRLRRRVTTWPNGTASVLFGRGGMKLVAVPVGYNESDLGVISDAILNKPVAKTPAAENTLEAWARIIERNAEQ